MPDITIDSNTPKNDILRYVNWCEYKVRVLEYLGEDAFRILNTYDNRILDTLDNTLDNALRFLPDPPSTTPSTP